MTLRRGQIQYAHIPEFYMHFAYHRYRSGEENVSAYVKCMLCTNVVQEAQLPQRNSASAAHMEGG